MRFYQPVVFTGIILGNMVTAQAADELGARHGAVPACNNYGVYLSSDHKFGLHPLNVQARLANDKASEAAGFLGVAVDHALGKNHAGIGYTCALVSNKAGAGKDDMSQFELYYRFMLEENFTLTPAVQNIRNSGFDNTNATVDSNVNVFSVRANYLF